MTKYEITDVPEPKDVKSTKATSKTPATLDGFAWSELDKNLYMHIDAQGIVYLKFDTRRRLKPAKVTDIVSTSHGFVPVGVGGVKINFNATAPKDD